MAIVVLCGTFTWDLLAQGYSDKAGLIMATSAILGLILVIIASFKPHTARITGSLYAVDGMLNNEDEQKPQLISIDFHDTSLYSVLNILSLKTGMKLITDTSLYGKKIMLSLK